MKYNIVLDFESYYAEDIEASSIQEAIKIAIKKMKKEDFQPELCGNDVYEVTP